MVLMNASVVNQLIINGLLLCRLLLLDLAVASQEMSMMLQNMKYFINESYIGLGFVPLKTESTGQRIP